MQYGYFDNEKREYVIDNVALPCSWTNYLGVEDMAAVINHTAGGYLFYKTPEYHRISRFRGNGVPMDRPGFYVYIRDNEKKDYHSISWQPVAKDLSEAKYRCRHGLSYTVYESEYDGLASSQTMVIPRGENVLLWDVRVKNTTDAVRDLSLFTYMEFSFHHIMIDNQNFQMSLYCAGSSYEDGIIEEDLFYEEKGYQYLTASFTPDGYDCVREKFLGVYGNEDHPAGVEKGTLGGSTELGGNHCGSLQKNFKLQPGEEIRFVIMLGEGNREEGRRIRAKYSDLKRVDAVYTDLAAYWEQKYDALQIQTPNEGMNTLINTWTLYQSEINVMFSRFASFIEVGGRVGLGYRDTAQDAMTIPHSNPDKCRERIEQLLKGLTTTGYGLHLFSSEWFEEKTGDKPFQSPTVIPEPDKQSMIHGIKDACSDDALWLVGAVVEYIKETGDLDFARKEFTYADTYVLGNKATESVYEHLKRILDFSAEQVGDDGICKGLRADWNDCLNLGGGESAMVSFLHYWALQHFITLAEILGEREDAKHYHQLANKVKAACDAVLWDGDWYIRGITKNGKKIGCKEDVEGKVHLESNAWAILSGVADAEKSAKTLGTIDEYLYTPYGLLLNTPSYTKPDDDIGFVTRVYPGLKENGAIFSHPNPWAWAAACVCGRGDLAMKFYDALCPYWQNDKIEIRESEPYSYCQFIAGKDHTAYGRARHPFMTGSGGWSYFSATRYMLGIRPDYDCLIIDPCIPADWEGFRVTRRWRGATYRIKVENHSKVMHGVKEILVDGRKVGKVPVFRAGTLRTLQNYVLDRKCDMGIATDGDADRIGVIDEKGNFLHPNDILVLLYYYLMKYKGWHGPVVRNICTTHMLDRVAESFGEKCYEVPVGFKHISAKMYATDAVIGGESSGGLTVRGHIKGKDGVYASALLVEMLAVTGKKLSEIMEEIHAQYGKLALEERDYRFSQEKKEAIQKHLLEEKKLPEIPYEVEQVSYLDGVKLYLKNGGWISIRFSGTEPLLRIFCEMPEAEDAKKLCELFEDYLLLK